MPIYSVPKAFTGTDAERLANTDSHHFIYDDDDGSRCMNCDSRWGSTSADYPCGASVPREIIGEVN